MMSERAMCSAQNTRSGRDVSINSSHLGEVIPDSQQQEKTICNLCKTK